MNTNTIPSKSSKSNKKTKKIPSKNDSESNSQNNTQIFNKNGFVEILSDFYKKFLKNIFIFYFYFNFQ